MSAIEIQTPAKINLVLDILRKRPDGFHEISSLMVKVGLYDQLRVEHAGQDEVEIVCENPDVPTDNRNLVHQAATKLGEHIGRLPGCRIHIEKRIPVAAGLGGGSGNAAGAFIALNELWQAGVAESELARLGASLGSDIPFFFGSKSAIVSSRGECVEPVNMSWNGWAALVLAGVHVSTADAYKHCTPFSPERYRDNLIELAAVDHAEGLRGGLRNGLEEAVFSVAPSVRDLHDRVRAVCGRPLRVSGAGAVLFDVFDTEAEAVDFSDRLRSGGVREPVCVVRAPIVD